MVGLHQEPCGGGEVGSMWGAGYRTLQAPREPLTAHFPVSSPQSSSHHPAPAIACLFPSSLPAANLCPFCLHSHPYLVTGAPEAHVCLKNK